MVSKEVVSKSQAFQRLTDSGLNRVLALCSERAYEAGATIFNEGDTAQELFIVEEGKVALQKDLPRAESPLGKRITVDIVSRGEVFGWSSMVEPYAYTLTAICLQKTTAIVIDGARLRSLLLSNLEIAHEVLFGLIKVVALRLSDTMHLLASERSMAVGMVLSNLEPEEKAPLK